VSPGFSKGVEGEQCGGLYRDYKLGKCYYPLSKFTRHVTLPKLYVHNFRYTPKRDYIPQSQHRRWEGTDILTNCNMYIHSQLTPN